MIVEIVVAIVLGYLAIGVLRIVVIALAHFWDSL